VRVLVVEPDRALAGVLCEELRAHGHEALPAANLEGGLQALAEAPFEVAVVDHALPDGDGLELRRRAEAHGLTLEVLTVADAAAAPAAFDGLWRGAYDCLLKPARMDELLALVAKAAEHARLRRDVARQSANDDADPIAVEPAMRAAVAGVERVAESDMPLLLLGESGSGKACLARFAHRRSARAPHPFVAADCSAADGGLEVRLFGGGDGRSHPRGPAWLPTAEKGTLFVRGLTDAAPQVQEKLAETLASGRYRPAGAERARRCDVRLLFGSRRDLRNAAEAGGVHGGLRARLGDAAIAIPPLRQRVADIEPLADHFLRRVAPHRRLSAEAHAELARYPWPGNVRELKLVVERAALLGEGETIGPAELALGASGNGWPSAAVRAQLSLAALEMQYIQATLAQNGGHRGRTARALGIDPKTLYNKLGPQRARRR
jgi:two-component system NtrC family response regulator